MDGESGFGLSHLSEHPITLTYGTVLLGALIVLILLRVLFGSVSGNVSAGGGVR